MVDQSRIGRTTRSNPASYVGAFDAIRTLFAKLPQARERKYTAGTFSFNAGNGRCPGCGGNGFEHVEMQFLSDVYLRCPDCNGRRYRAEILECKLTRGNLPPMSIADVLDLTVSEALTAFAADAEVCTRLAPLAEVGLDYLRLGQPVPTLSGGEAQRLKLAGHLAENAAVRRGARAERGSLFLFDEPTTGLHFDDVAKLLRSFRRLIEAGHSLLVIEHNLDVVRAADWVIELGPEGGDAGGLLVGAGTPEDIMRIPSSHTGRALLDALSPVSFAGAVQDADDGVRRAAAPHAIEIRGAREHNLKNIDVHLEHNRFTVITGVSGSGKSTLAFDILFAEGQRRYLESLNAYARQFVQPASRPDVDAIFGIPPTVAIEQRTSRGGRKSTVATLTEIYHFLRLLYVKLGCQYCPVMRSPDRAAVRRGHRRAAAQGLSRTGHHPVCAADRRAQGPVYGAREVGPRQGLSRVARRWRIAADGEMAAARSVRRAQHRTARGLAQRERGQRSAIARRACERARSRARCGSCASAPGRAAKCRPPCFPPSAPVRIAAPAFRSSTRACSRSIRGTAGVQAASAPVSRWRSSTASKAARRRSGATRTTRRPSSCTECGGERLNAVARHVLFRGLSIAALTQLPVQEFAAALRKFKLSGREFEIARDLLAELTARTSFLCDVGLGYLQLDRAAPTLSGGEAQRIRLAAQLGSNLQGVCYVLDEPTIGLHPRDNAALLGTLDRLRGEGNTLIVVEHDEDTIRRADHVIDLGPGAGTRGGQVVAQGTAAQLALLNNSPTGRCLAAPLRHSRARRRTVERATPSIQIAGATLHNLCGSRCAHPPRPLDGRHGRIGFRQVLPGARCAAQESRRVSWRAPARAAARGQDPAVDGCESITGWESISRVLEVDQTPIGKTPRSCPATYIGFWDSIRRLYAETTDARIRGFTASRFSFNTAGGRCEACEGQGMQRIEMNFLPDVQVLCDVCGGRRFNPETLAILFKGKSIGDDPRAQRR